MIKISLEPIDRSFCYCFFFIYYLITNIWLNHINDSDVQEKLKKIFYKFPTEWSMDKFDERYGWIKKDYFANDDKKFANFKAHVQSLAFWDEAGIPIDKNHWHFPPIEFIKHFRKCSWLSDGEFKQTLPLSVQSKHKWDLVNFSAAKGLMGSLRVNMNKAFRKYCINTPLRITGFLANAFEETIWMQTLKENGSYWWYHPWGGRGILQLTHPYNYSVYWEFLGQTISQDFKNYIARYVEIGKLTVKNAKGKTDGKATNTLRKNKMKVMQDVNYPTLAQYQSWRDDIMNKDSQDPTDSSGFYWASRNTNISQYADEPQILEAVIVGTQAYYRSPAFWKVCCVVNAGSYSSIYEQYGSHIYAFFKSKGDFFAVCKELSFCPADKISV